MEGEGGYWRQMSRRRLLRGSALGVAGLAAATALACTRSSAPPATTGAPTAGQPKRGGVIVHAGGPLGTYDTQGTTLDPHVNVPLGTRSFRHFYQGLLGYEFRTYAVEPELAQKWEQPSTTEYVFTLQPNVRWHNKPPANGRELTAEDVVWSFERARTNEPRFASRPFLFTVDKIEAVGKNQVRLTTSQQDGGLLNKIAADSLMVLAPEVVERAGRFATEDTAVGTGPFIMRSVEQNVGAEYVRNPDYWKAGLPYLDGIRSQHFNDEQPAYAAFRAGQVDVTRFTGAQAREYIARQGPGYTPEWFKDDSGLALFPNTKVKPFDDIRVGRALRLMIDHQEFKSAWAEVWFGAGRHGSIFTPAQDQWDLTEEEYETYLEWRQPKDAAVREAHALLSAAGFSRDNPLRFEMLSSQSGFVEAMTQLAQGQWRRFGQGVVDPSIRVVELGPWIQATNNRTFAYGSGGRSGITFDPDATLVQIYRTGGARNFETISDPKLDALIDRQRGIFDVQQRKAAIREIILYMMDNHPSTIPAGRLHLNGINPRLRGFAPQFYMNGRQFEKIWLDG
jgi:peptide/nickel transport system substrate-binding protein